MAISKIRQYLSTDTLFKIFPNGTDIDTCLGASWAGIYLISGSPVNTPEGVTYCMLIIDADTRTTANPLGSVTVQTIIDTSGIFTRKYRYTTSGGVGRFEWTSWYKYTGTVIT